MQRRRLPDTMALLVRAAVLAAVLGQFLPSGLASRLLAAAHPGHAYFEQPCCGRSHLRHHKEIQSRLSLVEVYIMFSSNKISGTVEV
ncbi:semaphorin-2A-like isoform X1, partial [Vespula maculifrons]